MGVTPLDYLTDHYRISKTWLAMQVQMSSPAFEYALKRGLRESEVVGIEKALLRASRKLRRGIPAPLEFESHCRSLGLNRTWIAQQLGLAESTALNYALKRGLRPEEKATLKLVFSGVADAFENFKIPKSLKSPKLQKAH